MKLLENLVVDVWEVEKVRDGDSDLLGLSCILDTFSPDIQNSN